MTKLQENPYSFTPNASRGEDYRAAIQEAQDARKEQRAALESWTGLVGGSVDLLEQIWKQLLDGGAEENLYGPARSDLQRYFEEHQGEDLAHRMQQTALLERDEIIDVRWGSFISTSRYGDANDISLTYRGVVNLLQPSVYTKTVQLFREVSSRGTPLNQPLAKVYGVAFTNWRYGEIQRAKNLAKKAKSTNST